MKKQYDIYIKKLTTQELGYRRGRLMTGGYFYITKSAIGSFFKELDKLILNDFLRLDFNDPLEEDNTIKATYVYHNDKFAIEDGTRNEYRIYHNRDIATHNLHFQPFEIIVFFRTNIDDKYTLMHYKQNDNKYEVLDNIIVNSKIRGNHALLSLSEYKILMRG